MRQAPDRGSARDTVHEPKRGSDGGGSVVPAAQPEQGPGHGRLSVSIRSRLLLLVLAVLLPGVACGVWMVSQTIHAETQAHERALRDSARALGTAVERRLQERATVARLLSLSRALDAAPLVAPDDMADFAVQAQRAVAGSGGWVELSDATRVLFDSRRAGAAPAGQLPAAPDSLVSAPLLTHARGAAPAAAGAAGADTSAGPGTVASPVAIVYPVQRNGSTRLNLTVTVPATDLQAIVAAQPTPAQWINTVLDSRGVVLARQPAAHLGQSVRPELLAQMAGRSEGRFTSMSLDGMQAVGYFNTWAQGFSTLSAMPQRDFGGSSQAAVLQASTVALLLLALAAGGAVWVTRSIVKPVVALKLAAERLQAGAPIAHEATGIFECDEVASALAEASESIRHARADLERQVDDAVQRTRAAEQRSAQSQRVEALGRLTGGVAHDFNNLLGVVSNSTHLVQRHTAGQAELQMPLAAIQRAVDVGSRLTQTLLRFAGRQTVRPQQVDLGLYLPEAHDLLASVLGQRIQLQTTVEPGTAPVTLDVGELELALINLALNTRDAMQTAPQGGGHVWVRACNADADDAAGLPPLPGGYVLVNFSDDGAGMDASVAERVFEPFYTTKSVGKGTGLGLSQVHGFCTQAGGTARLGSTPGLGTTVSLLLPASGTHAAPGALPAATALPSATPATSALAGVRLLLVEDNDELATVTEALLRSYGCSVHRTSNADDALLWLRSQPALDAVLSDIVMPGSLDGLGLARVLRAQQPDLPLLLMSGFTKALAAAKEFVVLNKPYQQDALVAALLRVLAPKT